jgi:hypothetical protein
MHCLHSTDTPSFSSIYPVAQEEKEGEEQDSDHLSDDVLPPARKKVKTPASVSSARLSPVWLVII